MSEEMNQVEGFLDLALNEIPDLANASAGEHTVRILSAAEGLSKSTNKPMVTVTLKVTDEENTKSIRYYLSYPTSGDDKTTAESRGRRINSFAKAFGVGFNSISEFSQAVKDNALDGLEAMAILVNESDPEFGESTKVKYFLTER